MEVTTNVDPLRQAVREHRDASLYTDGNQFRVELTQRGVDVWADTITDAALTMDYVLTAAEYDAGEQLLLEYTPRDDHAYGQEETTKSEFKTRIYDDATFIEEPHQPGDTLAITSTTPTSVMANGYIRTLNRCGVPIIGVSANNRESPTITLRVDFEGDGKDPYEMDGINTREHVSLRRHDALTIVKALDAFESDQCETEQLKSRLIADCHLESYLPHLGDESSEPE